MSDRVRIHCVCRWYLATVDATNVYFEANCSHCRLTFFRIVAADGSETIRRQSKPDVVR